MGDYTGIRFKGYIKLEFREIFEDIALKGEWYKSEDEVFRKFGEINRSSFLPCGWSAYMPDCWEDVNENATDGFERTYNKETGYWTFQCSLKNYENTIQKWFDILPYFIEKIEHLEYFYEYYIYSEQYDLIEGKIQLINNKFIKYGYDSDDRYGY